MSKPENDLQVTIRMPSLLKNEIDEFVSGTGITSMEFIRRAIKEKLERDQTTICPAETKFKTQLLSAIKNDEEIRTELLLLLK